MNVDGILSVDYKEGVFTPKSLKEFTEEKEGLFAFENKIVSAPAVALDKSIEKRFKAVKLYNVNGRLLIFVKEGNLYEILERGVKKLCGGLKEPPLIAFVEYLGKKGFIAITKDESKIITDATFDINVPYGNTCEFFYDSLFMGRGRKLFVAKKNEKGEFYSDSLSFIMLEQKLGAIEKLVKVGNSLLIFRKRGISELSLIDTATEYKLSELETVPVFCDGQTVKKVGNEIYFIDKSQGFCCYKNGSVYKAECSLDFKNFTLLGEAVQADNYYILPINDENGEKKFFIYDTIKKTDCFLRADNLLMCDGGYAFNYNLNEYGALGKDVPFLRRLKSVITDFDCEGLKTLYKVKIKSSENGILMVKGKYESRSFALKRGMNVFSTRVISDFFVFEVLSEKSELSISEPSFFYRK